MQKILQEVFETRIFSVKQTLNRTKRNVLICFPEKNVKQQSSSFNKNKKLRER